MREDLIRSRRLWRRVAGVVVLSAVLALVPVGAVIRAEAATTDSATWEQFLADRPELLRRLAPPIVACFQRGDTGHAIFHGCIDWHSAVHAAYSHHALYRRLDDRTYLDLVEAQIAPNGVSLIPQETLPFGELPYGYAWFLALVRERETATEKTDFREMANEAASRLVGWFESLSTNTSTQTQRILAADYVNYSWALINLDRWARYTRDETILAATRQAALRLRDPAYDTACPAQRDANPAAGGFIPPCLMRLAAVAHVLEDEAKDWVTVRSAVYVPPITSPVGCHAGGLNFYRAFALYNIYRASGLELHRDNYVELIRYHVSRPDLYAENYNCYAHWVAQVGVRAISLSYSEDTTLAYTGETLLANGGRATLSAALRDDGVAIGGRAVTLTLGSGASAQSCTGETDASGTASCTIAPVAQPNGPGTVLASFAGGSVYQAASGSAATLVYDFAPGRGAFVVGDGNAVPGATVTFWSSQWAKLNTLSGGPAPSTFKGFAANPARPGCGTRWSSDPGNSATSPPAPLPDYIGVIVTGSATKSAGSPQIRGDSKHIVVVKTESYSPTGSGTGTVAANVCSLLEAQLPEVSVGSPAEGGLVDPGDQIAYAVAVTDPQDGSTASGSIGCDAVTVELVQVEESDEVTLESQHACAGGFSLPPDPAPAGERVLGFLVRASYTDRGSPFVAPLTDVAEATLGLKHIEAENVDPTLSAEPSTDPGGAAGDQDVVLAPGSVVSLGFVSLDRLTGIRFRAFSAGGTLELRRDSASGPLLASVRADGSVWETVSTPLAASGGHALFLVASGEPLRLNWLEFAGAGAASNQRPHVNATVSPAEGETPLTVQFAGQATDPEGDQNLTYSWDFDDGQSSSEANSSNVYYKPRSYRPRLSVRDSSGAVSVRTFRVTVTPQPIVCDPAASTPGPNDEFDRSRLDGCRWNAIINPDPNTLWVANGAVNIALQTGSFGSSLGLSVTSVRNLILQHASADDWTIEAKFDALLGFGDVVGVTAYHDDAAWVQLYVRRDSPSSYIAIAVSSRRDVFRPTWSIGGIQNSGTTWWLRLSKRGVTYTTHVSTDGSSWRTFAPSGATNTNAVNPAIVDPKIGIFTLTYCCTAGTAAFDYFKLTKP